MIRFANENDDIKSLFDRCFTGAEEFSRYFFEKIYKEEHTLVYKIDGKIVSMLQMLPYDTNLGKATYLFGVCTDENYRKQGYSAKLLEKSFEIAKERGHKTVVLVPEEKWLFDFYAKFGFEKGLNFEKNTIITKEKNDVDIRVMTIYDIEKVSEIYKNEMKSEFFIDRSYEFFKWQIDLYGEGSKVYLKDEKILGYSFGYNKDGIIVLDEIVSENYELCLKSYEFAEVKYRKPNGKENLGMIKFLENQKKIDGYMNLMFN